MSFEAPATSTLGPKPAELEGHLLIITPVEYKTGIQTSLGEAEAISVDLVDLDTNTVHNDVLFFNVALRTGLRSKIGGQVLARIGQGTAKPGKSAPWILVDATQSSDDIKKATDYLAKGFAASAVTPAEKTSAISAVADINDPAIQALLAQLGGTAS